jgi:hypothetical protein
MPHTGFRPEIHGFAFTNRWHFDAEERRRLRDRFAVYLRWSTLLGAATFGLGAIAVPLGIRELRQQLESHLGPIYGLCGGMCYTALDLYTAALPAPRGAGVDDQPIPGTRLRSYIWRRQVDSLSSDGARFMAWLIYLNYIPPRRPFGGGPLWLRDRAWEEWQTLKRSIDAGQPIPIGLTREVRNVYENHQVLAIGYDETSTAQGTIYLYDPNCPDRESTIDLTFEDAQLTGRESCYGGPPLRGFFCETYQFRDPGELSAGIP